MADRAEAFDRTHARLDAETRRDAGEVLTRLRAHAAPHTAPRSISLSLSLDSAHLRRREARQARVSELERCAGQLRADIEQLDRLSLEISNAESHLEPQSSQSSRARRARDGAESEQRTAALMSKIGFIHRFAELCHEVEASSARAAPRVPETEPDAALPRELADRLEAVAATRGWAEALDVKDEMLWELADRLQGAEQKLCAEKELTEEYSAEIAHWVDLTRELQAELDASRTDLDRTGAHARDLRRLAHDNEMLTDELTAAKNEQRAMREEIRRLRANTQRTTTEI